LYWTNIPGIEQPIDKGIKVKDIIGEENIIVHNLYGGFKEKKCRTFATKCPTLRTSAGGGHIPSVFNGTEQEAKTWELPYLRDIVRTISPEEAECFQTVPVGYTQVDKTSNTQRYKMLGNGWTVDVVSHILKGLVD
jgi:site-specific DNA-cytosine methylase